MKSVSYIHRIAERIWDPDVAKYWKNVSQLMAEALEMGNVDDALDEDNPVLPESEIDDGELYVKRAPAFLSGVVKTKGHKPLTTDYNPFRGRGKGTSSNVSAYKHLRDCIDKDCDKSYHRTSYGKVAKQVAEDRALGRI